MFEKKMLIYVSDIFLLLPEVYFLASILSLLWLSVSYSSNNSSIGKLLSIQVGSLFSGILVVTLVLYSNMSIITYVLFNNNSFISDPLSKFFIYFAIFGVLIHIMLGLHFVKVNNLNAFELFFIFGFVLFGFILLSISNDFLGMYMGIEMQSLGLYILATLKQGSIFATEAGLKYFVLGAFASCLLILGIAIVYSFTGLMTFTEINIFLLNLYEKDIFYQGLFIGLLLIFVSLLFKVGGAPFHVWVPDVYEGIATIITGFFAIVPKIVIFGIILKINMCLGEFFFLEFAYIFLISGCLSLGIGIVGAIYQDTWKRMMSYSAIGQTGFLLLVVSLATADGVISMIFYCIVYTIISLNIFTSLLQLQQDKHRGGLKWIKNLGYVYKINDILCINLIVSLFSLAGIPPFSGFYSKFYVFLALVQQDYLVIAAYAILLSGVGNGYILVIVRNFMFSTNKRKSYEVLEVNLFSGMLIMYTGVLNIIFLFICDDLHYICSSIIMQ